MISKRRKRIIFYVSAAIMVYAIYTFFDIRSNIKAKEEACFTRLVSVLQEGATPEEIFNQDYQKLQMLVEFSLVARSRMLEVSNKLRVRTDEAFSSRDLITLKEGTEDYLEIREDLYRIANGYACAVEAEETTLVDYGIDPGLRLKGSMLSLAAALTLYDNYLMGTVLFEQDPRLRKVINDPDMGFGLVSNTLQEMTLSANSIENRHRIRRVITFYEEEKEKLKDLDEDSDYAYLELLIDSSPAYNYVKKVRIGEIAGNKYDAMGRIAADMMSEAQKDGFDVLSGFFGNTVGLYESRKGKLHGDSEARKVIQAKLQPLDILLEKTPFRLTDKLIPGHFGHVAIWTGTKTELIDLKIWDNPYVKSHQDQIESGEDPNSKDQHQIIEALRSGVQLSTLDHFMNVDDIAILRPVFSEEMGFDAKKEAIIMAFRQLGKKYDFNFDVNTTDKIVCSELAYISFPTIDWPTEKTLGRHSISPDNVAELAWNNVPLELILFYHDGQLVDESIQVEKMKELMTL